MYIFSYNVLFKVSKWAPAIVGTLPKNRGGSPPPTLRFPVFDFYVIFLFLSSTIRSE